MIEKLKKKYCSNATKLKKNFLKNHNNKVFLSGHTALVDKLLRELWKEIKIKKNIALIGVGGYGRKELFPYSDIDILVLCEQGLSKDELEKITLFIRNSWDLGLKIGHSVRDISQCIKEFDADVTTATNLLETIV